jgi:hypothetical protein
MNKQGDATRPRSKESDASVVRHVLLFSLLLLGLLVAGSCSFYGWSFARSILIGGLLVNGSFWLLKKDAERLMQRLGEADGNAATKGDFEKSRFFLRSCARFVVLGLLLFVLASQVAINVVGLTVGFATIMVSVVIIGLGAGRCSMLSKA